MALTPSRRCVAALHKSPSTPNWIRDISESRVTRRVAQFNALSCSFRFLQNRRSSCSDACAAGESPGDGSVASEPLWRSGKDPSPRGHGSDRDLSFSEEPDGGASGSPEERVEEELEASGSPAKGDCSGDRWRSIRERLESLSLRAFWKGKRSPRSRSRATRAAFSALPEADKEAEEIEECGSRSPQIEGENPGLTTSKRMPRHSSPLPKKKKSKMPQSDTPEEQFNNSSITSPAVDISLHETTSSVREVFLEEKSPASGKGNCLTFSDYVKSPDSILQRQDKSSLEFRNIRLEDVVTDIFRRRSSFDASHNDSSTSHSTIREPSVSVSCTTLPTLDSISEIQIDATSIIADEFPSSYFHDSDVPIFIHSFEQRPIVENPYHGPGILITYNPHNHPEYRNLSQKNESRPFEEHNCETKSEAVSFKSFSSTHCSNMKTRWNNPWPIKVFNPQHHPALKNKLTE